MSSNYSDDASLEERLAQLEAELERERRQHTAANFQASPQPGTPQSGTPQPSPPTPRRTVAVPVPRRVDQTWQGLKQNFKIPLLILAFPWLQELIDQVIFRGGWNFVLHPRSLAGIPGIFLSAFSHANFMHLLGNSIAFAIFSWLILLKSRRDYWITLLVGWLGGGLACWFLGPASVHGLSGVVYTLFGYLLTIGWLEKRFVSLVISVFVLMNFSSNLWGILPLVPWVAWWGHLIGLLLGVFAAYGVYREPGQQK